MRLLVRLLLSALAFTSILPMIHGISFHGSFWAGVILSAVFAVMLWVVELICTAMATILTVGSLGLALLWIIPLWIVGFWLLPAFALLLTSDFLPQYLTVSGFFPAALAGLVLLFVGLLTSEMFWGNGRPAAQ